MFSGGARESRDSVSGLPVSLNEGMMGWRSANLGQIIDHRRFSGGNLDRYTYVRLCSVKSGRLN